MRRTAVVSTVLLGLALAGAGQASAAPGAGAGGAATTLTSVGRWPLDALKALDAKDNSTADSTGYARAGKVQIAGARVTVDQTPLPDADVATAARNSFAFKGWHEATTASPTIDATGSAVRVDPISAKDSTGSTLDPGTSAFSASIWVHPDAVPTSTTVLDYTQDKLNIMQKGLSDPADGGYGFWKISMRPNLRPMCAFIGFNTAAHTTKTKLELEPTAGGSVPGSKDWTMTAGVDYKITCLLTPPATAGGTGTAQLRVDGEDGRNYRSALVSTGTYFDVVTKSDATLERTWLWIGKKPGSTLPGDAFAGRLDNAEVKKG